MVLLWKEQKAGRTCVTTCLHVVLLWEEQKAGRTWAHTCDAPVEGAESR